MIGPHIALTDSIAAHRRRHGAAHFERLVGQACEEMGELIQALHKRVRAREEVFYDLHVRQNRPLAEANLEVSRVRLTFDIEKELADLMLCLEHLQEDLGIDDEYLRTLVVEAARSLTFNCEMEMKK